MKHTWFARQEGSDREGRNVGEDSQTRQESQARVKQKKKIQDTRNGMALFCYLEEGKHRRHLFEYCLSVVTRCKLDSILDMCAVPDLAS